MSMKQNKKLNADKTRQAFHLTGQSGWINDDGTEVTQSWYCGYFPYEDPQYVVTVLKENGEGGSVDCAPVFAYIADEILKLS